MKTNNLNIHDFKEHKNQVIQLYPSLKPSDKSLIIPTLNIPESHIATKIDSKNYLFWSSLTKLTFAKEYKDESAIFQKHYNTGMRCFQVTNFGKEMIPIVMNLADMDEQNTKNTLTISGEDYLLGQAFYHQKTKDSYKNAYYHYTNGALKGFGANHFMLGLMHQYGFYVNKDYKKAFEFFFKATESTKISTKHQAEAFLHLGLLHELNQIMSDDNPQAAYEFYKKSADMGNIEAFVKLSIFYEEGYGTESNQEKSIYFLKKASDHGYMKAAKKLSHYYYAKNQNNEAFIYALIAIFNGGNTDEMYDGFAIQKNDTSNENLIQEAIKTEFTHAN